MTEKKLGATLQNVGFYDSIGGIYKAKPKDNKGK